MFKTGALIIFVDFVFQSMFKRIGFIWNRHIL